MRMPLLQSIARAGLEILIGASIVFGIAGLLWKLGVLNAFAAKQRGEAIVQQETAKATGTAAAQAVTITNEVHREITRIDEITRRNEDEITAAAGADAHAPDVAAALRSALCLRTVYLDSPACKAPLRGDRGGIEPPQPDPGRPAPGI